MNMIKLTGKVLNSLELLVDKSTSISDKVFTTTERVVEIGCDIIIEEVEDSAKDRAKDRAKAKRLAAKKKK
jgi:hypothetical protein